MPALWTKFNSVRHVFNRILLHKIEVCQALFNFGDHDMQISKLICFISSLTIPRILYQKCILKLFLEFNVCLLSSETRKNVRNEFETEYPEIHATKVTDEVQLPDEGIHNHAIINSDSDCRSKPNKMKGVT